MILFYREIFEGNAMNGCTNFKLKEYFVRVDNFNEMKVLTLKNSRDDHL